MTEEELIKIKLRNAISFLVMWCVLLTVLLAVTICDIILFQKQRPSVFETLCFALGNIGLGISFAMVLAGIYDIMRIRGSEESIND